VETPLFTAGPRGTCDGCLQRPVEAFHQTVACWVVGGCPEELGSTHPGEGAKELLLELLLASA
jgi:hypothetical protein